MIFYALLLVLVLASFGYYWYRVTTHYISGHGAMGIFSSVPFGTPPIINSFTINGDPSTATIPVNTSATLAWTVTGATDVQITTGSDYSYSPWALTGSTATAPLTGSRNFFLQARNGGVGWDVRTNPSVVEAIVHSIVVPSVSAPNLSQIYASDSCNRASSATTPNPPSDGGVSWQALGGSTWGIITSTNGFTKTGIYSVSNQTGDLCVRDVTHSDVYHAMRITGDFPNHVCLAFRVSDVNNFWYLDCQTSGVTLRKVVAGVDSLVGTLMGIDGIVAWTTSSTQFLGDVAAIDCSGSTIKCYFNGTLGLTVTDAFNSTATMHGVRNVQGGGLLANMFFTGASGCMLDQALLVPDFCANATTHATKSGSFFDPTVWSGGSIPGLTDIATIGNPFTVTVDGFSNTPVLGVGIKSGGSLIYVTNKKVRLTVCHLVVYDTDGVNPQGYLEVGNTANPINATLVQDQTAAQVLASAPYSAKDANKWGAGLYVYGKMRMCGTAKTTWVRTSAAPKAGDKTITLASPVSGWVQGDRLFLPDSHALTSSEIWTAPPPQPTPHYEALVLESVSADGKTITFISATNNSNALAFDHPGSQRPIDSVVEYTPHICNLSMWASVRTTDPTDNNRPHVLVSNRANFDCRYATFHSTGRACPFPGRAIQFRRLWGPAAGGLGYDATVDPPEFKPGDPANTLGLNGPSFRLYGCTVFDPLPISGLIPASAQWGIVHDEGTSFGLTSHCASVNWGGSGIMAHGGGERSNVWEYNFVSLIRGSSSRADFDGTGTDGAFGHPDNQGQGVGIWPRNHDQIIRFNVVSDVRGMLSRPSDGFSYGISMNPLVTGGTNPITAVPRTPTSQGVNPFSTNSSDRMTFNPSAAGSLIRGNHDNETYGGYSGFTLWYAQHSPSSSYIPYQANLTPSGTLSNMVVWNNSNLALFLYPTSNVTLDSWVVRGGPLSLVALWSSDYATQDLTISNCNLQTMGQSALIEMLEGGLNKLTIVNCTLAGKGKTGSGKINIFNRTYGGGADRGQAFGYEFYAQHDQWNWDRSVVINNCTYLTSPGDNGINIFVGNGDSSGGANGTGSRAEGSLLTIQVINHNGVGGDNFFVYDTRQLPGTAYLQQTQNWQAPFYVGCPIGAAFNPTDFSGTITNQPTQTNQLMHDSWNPDARPKSRPMMQYIRRGQMVVAPNPDTPGICLNAKLVPTGYSTRTDITGYIHMKGPLA